MGTGLARFLDLIPTTVRQFIPLNGIFADAWQPSTAIALYWLESVLLAAVAVVMCWRFQRRTSDRAIESASGSGDTARAEMLADERERAEDAGIDPGAVLMFHGAGLGVFGVFLGAILFIMTDKGHLAPFNWEEFRGAASTMMLVIGAGFVLDMLMFRTMGVPAVQSRVHACLGRWALLWLLGFVGTGLLVFTGKAGAFIGLFAVLKAVWEGWGMLARLFGWKAPHEHAEEQSA